MFESRLNRAGKSPDSGVAAELTLDRAECTEGVDSDG
jgi:hypothetical protein